jgi:hypothetical protein
MWSLVVDTWTLLLLHRRRIKNDKGSSAILYNSYAEYIKENLADCTVVFLIHIIHYCTINKT